MREGMFVKVIAASRHFDKNVNPIITIHARYPRFIHAELMSHRTFCISGDTVIDFDLPKGQRGSRKIYSMTVREFAGKWFFGAERHIAPSFNGKRLDRLDPCKMYSAEQIARELGHKNHTNLNDMCRKGDVLGAEKPDGYWVALGESWAAWRKKSGYRDFSIRNRLKEMKIRQYDEKTGAVVTSNVKNVIMSGAKRVFRLEAGNYSVSATEDHRILTSAGWKRLGDIAPGSDSVITYNYGTGANEDSNRFSKINGRWVQTWARQIRNQVAERQGYLCAGSGKPLEQSFHIHHLLPRHKRPDLAFDINNVIAVNPDTHAALHKKQGWQIGVPLLAAPTLVDDIIEEGVVDTYDLEIAGNYANFFANGIVVHNSRNSRSSRAVPIQRLINEVEANPVIPWHWGKNQPGMQAWEECSEKVLFSEYNELGSCLRTSSREAAWRDARDHAVKIATAFMQAGYHKQVVNRLLEPFMWIDTLITATEWDNFFCLRCHKDAEPHFQDLANMIRAAIENAEYQELEMEQWHLPYITAEETREYGPEILLKLSAARCARVSYAPFDGNGDAGREIERFNRLITSKPVHASPIEHQAKAVSTTICLADLEPDDEIPFGYCGNFDGGWH